MACRVFCICEAPPGELVEPVRRAGRLPQARQALPIPEVQSIDLRGGVSTHW